MVQQKPNTNINEINNQVLKFYKMQQTQQALQEEQKQFTQGPNNT